MTRFTIVSDEYDYFELPPVCRFDVGKWPVKWVHGMGLFYIIIDYGLPTAPVRLQTNRCD